MPPIPIETLLSRFNKRDHTQDQGEDDNDVNSPAMMVGLIIAALTLLVAAVPLFRSPPFRRWVFSFSILSFVKKNLGIIALPTPPPTTTAAKEDLTNNASTDIPIPNPALISCGHSNISSHRCNAITREDSRVPQVEESLGPRRPRPVVTWPSS